MDHADRDVEPAALAARQRVGRPRRHRRQLERIDQLVGPPRRVATRQAVRPALGEQLVAGALVVRRRRAPARRSRSARRTAAGSAMTSCPATVALPVVGRSSVVSMRRLVDFPAPFGPRNATSSPCPDVDVEAAHRLDRLLADPELAGQASCVDHRASFARAGWGRCPYRRIDCGHFLAAILTRIRAWPTRADGCSACSRCCRPIGPGRAASSPSVSGVSERTLRRDIDRLRELGYPVAAAPGVGGGYQLEPGATLPPLLLDDDEAIAIAVALRSSAGGGIEGIEETSVRALTKVVRTMPPRLRARVDTLRAVHGTRPVGRRADGRPRPPSPSRPGLPGPRAAALRVHGPGRRRRRDPPRRAPPAGHPRPPLVPHRLGHRSRRLADLPRGPPARSALDALSLRAARATRR